MSAATVDEFSRAMATLVALKRTADLTAVQMKAWYSVLGAFPIRVVNAAIIELVLTEVRFPEVGDLYTICRRTLPKQYAPLGTGIENDKPSKAEIATIAARIGLEV